LAKLEVIEMKAVPLRQVVRQLRTALCDDNLAQLSDAELWGRYVRAGEEFAFEALLRRHGPMVLGVCRRLLGNEQDAEDAFQATFLVLIRKAASLRTPQTLANWLHGVARRTALEARRLTVQRRAREAALLPRVVQPDDPDEEIRFVLDQELGRLAEKYRTAIVVCDLEGKSRKEAAQLLGWAEGTVASRLARGRGLLAKRLARRGLAGVLGAAAWADAAAPACVPYRLLVATTTAVSQYGMLSATVAALTKGVLQSMFFIKLKSVCAVLLALTLATVTTGVLISRSRATEPLSAAADDEEPLAELHLRAVELKQQVQQMQKKVAQLERATQPRRSPELAERFKYRVPIELGYTETHEGGRIEIREVWGTRPRIEEGGQYLVRGSYVLPPGAKGKLYFYATASGAWGQGPTLDLQMAMADKERGEFTLLHGMGGPGYFHIVLADPERYSRMFANVYFGTGDYVLRRKP
jgi:RNA polymerase sigma factor (sigma-70 family)